MSENQHRTLKDQFMVRLPEGIREQIKAVADAHGRSMNAEIVFALERHLQLQVRQEWPATPDYFRTSVSLGSLSNEPESLDAERIRAGAGAVIRLMNELQELLEPSKCAEKELFKKKT